MKPKQIVKRKTGEFLTIEEDKKLCHSLRIQVGASFEEYESVSGYCTPLLAERYLLNSVYDAYEGYTFAYIGTEYKTLEGYKIIAIALKKLPQDFESRFQDYVVLG